MINVQPYQARLPMHSSGGVTSMRLGMQDLRQRPEANPIVAALQQILEGKRQTEEDELKRRLTEAKIAEMGQEKPRQGKIVKAGDKYLLIDPVTGETIKEIPIPPESGRKLLEELAKMSELEDKGLLTRLEPKILDTRKSEIRNELMERGGLEEAEEEYTHDPWWGKPRTKTRKVIRKKGTPITEALEATKKVESREIKEPATVEEFEAEVARLKKIDMKAAKAYYNKWKVKWQ